MHASFASVGGTAEMGLTVALEYVHVRDLVELGREGMLLVGYPDDMAPGA